MNCYEYTFIAKQDLVENQNEKVLEKYQEIINKKTIANNNNSSHMNKL